MICVRFASDLRQIQELPFIKQRDLFIRPANVKLYAQGVELKDGDSFARGSGIKRMKSLLKKAGLPPPKFEMNGFFIVTFRRKKPLIEFKNYLRSCQPNKPSNGSPKFFVFHVFLVLLPYLFIFIFCPFHNEYGKLREYINLLFKEKQCLRACQEADF